MSGIFDDFREGDFVAVLPKGAAKAALADVTVRSFKLRKAERVRIMIADRVLAELGSPVRFRLEFSATRRMFLLTSDAERGRYEPSKIGRGTTRGAISFSPPPGLVWRAGEEDPEFWVDAATGRLAIEVPGFLLPMRVGPPAGPTAAAVEAARRAVPAPSFSGRRT